MNRPIIILLVFGLFLETRPNIFKDFFYKQEKVKLTCGNYLVCEDKEMIEMKVDFTDSSTDDKEKELTFSYYEANNNEELLNRGSTLHRSLLDNNTNKFFKAIINTTTAFPKTGSYNTFKRLKKVMVVPSVVVAAKKNGYIAERIINKSQKHTVYQLEKDIDASESVLNKTRVALSIFGVCLLGYFAQGYAKSGTTAN